MNIKQAALKISQYIPKATSCSRMVVKHSGSGTAIKNAAGSARRGLKSAGRSLKK